MQTIAYSIVLLLYDIPIRMDFYILSNFTLHWEVSSIIFFPSLYEQLLSLKGKRSECILVLFAEAMETLLVMT